MPLFSKRALASLVRAYGSRSIAESQGVSRSTVNRWLRTRIPEARHEGLVRLKATVKTLAGAGINMAPRASKRDVSRALALSSRSLAMLGGVSQSTARKWKAAGSIPPRSQRFLTEVAPEARPRKLNIKTTPFVGRFTRGTQSTMQLHGTIITAQMLPMLLAFCEQAGTSGYQPPTTTYQIVMDGHSFLLLKEGVSQSSYQTIELQPKDINYEQPKDGRFKNELIIASKVYSDRPRTIQSFFEAISNQQFLESSFQANSITLWTRRPLKVGPPMRQTLQVSQ